MRVAENIKLDDTAPETLAFRRDQQRKRLLEFVAMLGLDATAVSTANPGELPEWAAKVRGRLRDEEREDRALLNVGEPVTLGAREYLIKEKPWAQAAEWKDLFSRRMEELTRYQSELLGELGDDEDQQVAVVFRVANKAEVIKRELVQSYIGELPEDATDSQIERAMEVARAQAFSFFKRIEGLSPALLNQVAGRG